MKKNDILYPLRKLHGSMHDRKEMHAIRNEWKKAFRENPRTVMLCMTPEHGNIGDHAIAMAETNMLEKLGIQYIEVTGTRLELMRRSNQLAAMNGFPIVMNGGGYLGTVWMDEERLVRQIVTDNPKSEILFLPNTAFYEDSEWGNEEFQKSKEIFRRHGHLRFYTRERVSYEKMKNSFDDVTLMPDMVLSFEPYATDQNRKGCLLCLRSDREKTRTDAEETVLRNLCEKLFPGNIGNVDMISPESIPVKQRKDAVINKLNEFCGAELVITDRLHGMIFCAVTGTPCIVINSRSPKIKGCYEWIKDLEYICFIDNVREIETAYRKINHRKFTYSNQIFEQYFSKLQDDLMKLTN